MVDITLLDKKILNILVSHGNMDYAEIARLTGTSTERIYYRIKRLFTKGIINEYKILLSYKNLSYNQYNLFIKLKKNSNSIRQKLQEYFKIHPYVVWVGTCIGEYDFRVYVIAKDHFHLKEILDKLDKDLYEYTDSLMVLHRIKKYDGNNFLTFRKYSTQKEIDEIQRVLTNIKVQQKDKSIDILDDKDMNILKVLCLNPRSKYTELAQKLHISPEDVKYHIKKINSTPIISNYSISVNYPKLGLLWLAVLIKLTNKQKEKQFMDYVLNEPQTINVIENMGEWDHEITFYAKNIEEADEYLLNLREKHADMITDFKFFITKDSLKYPQVALGLFDDYFAKLEVKK
jgi:DNA-binding Lrp family transcriptional regulator